jgi:hypothetical protein
MVFSGGDPPAWSTAVTRVVRGQRSLGDPMTRVGVDLRAMKRQVEGGMDGSDVVAGVEAYETRPAPIESFGKVGSDRSDGVSCHVFR